LDLIQEININEHSFKEQNLNISNVLYNIRFIVKNTPVSYLQLSYGTQRVLMILLALLYDKSTTLLIEQPEDGIHIGLLRKVLAICFEYAEVYNKQLIITTHSPEVINMFQPESIRLVKMTEKGTKVSIFDKEEIPLIYDYLENEGALSDFIKSMNED
jgi:predicted ATPase